MSEVNLIGLNKKVWNGSLKNTLYSTDDLTAEEADWIVEAVKQRLNRTKIRV